MRNPRIIAIVLLCSLLLVALPAGCGSSGSESPAGVANKIIGAYRAGNASEGGTFFIDPQVYGGLVEVIPDGTTLRVDNEVKQDDKTATVDILFGLKEGSGGYRLIMVNDGTAWKVTNFAFVE